MAASLAPEFSDIPPSWRGVPNSESRELGARGDSSWALPWKDTPLDASGDKSIAAGCDEVSAAVLAVRGMKRVPWVAGAAAGGCWSWFSAAT